MSVRVIWLFLAVLGVSTAEVFEWAILMMEKESETLTCEDGFDDHKLNASLASEYVLKWKLPNNVVLNSTHSDAMFSVRKGQNEIEGFVLEVKSFEEKYAGVYLCMVEGSALNHTFEILRGINIHTRKYSSISAKYETHIITAVVATLIFIVPILGGCLVYRFRWQSEEEKAQHNKQRAMKDYGHDNNVMVEVPSKAGAETVNSADGGGAYENPVAKSDSTQL